MNRRFCAWVGAIIISVGLVSAASAQALPGGALPGGVTPAASPAAAGPVIPPAAETASDATPYTPQIHAFIQTQLLALSGADYSAQTAARDALRKMLTRGSTPSYYAVFCREWVAACTAALTKTPPPALGLRLNVGIVTSTLTDNGQTMDPSAVTGAEQLVALLLSDSSPSVSMWGIKASRPLIVLRVQAPKPAIDTWPVVTSLVAAIKKHQSTELAGFMAQDCYSALAVREIPGLNADKLKSLQPNLVPPILDILAARTDQYKGGSIQSPGAEREIATFLASQYSSVDAASKKRIVQELVNLVTYAGQRSDQYINSRNDLAQMRDMLKYESSALKVIANDKQVDTSLSWLSAIPPASSPVEIVAHTKLVANVMKTVFSWLTVPASIPVIEPPAPIVKPVAPAATPATPGTTPAR